MLFYSKTLLTCCLFLLLLASCTSWTEINVKKDGSAHVSAHNLGILNPEAFFKSEQITDFTWQTDSLSVSFNIKNIDSLGNYLYDDFEKNYFKFHYSNDTLTFSDGNTPTYRYRRYPCWTSHIVITSEKPIKSVETKNSFVKHKNGSVTISKKGRKFKKTKKDTKVVVIFGE